MTDSDQKLIVQMKNLRKLLHSGVSGVQIYDFLSGTIHLIEKNDNEIEVYKGLCELLDIILCYSYIKDNLLDSESLKFVFTKFKEHCNQTNYQSWGLIFAKLYGREISFNHPLVFADLVYLSRFFLAKKNRSADWLNFHFDNIDLSALLAELKDDFIGMIEIGSTFSLYLDTKARNGLAKFLYENCSDSTKNYKIFFPFAKTLIEPILIAYLTDLRCEAIKGSLPENITFYVTETDPLFDGSIQNVYSYYEEMFLKLKTSFAQQNNRNVKNIKTNLKIVKKQIIKKSDKDLKKIRFDYVIVNPFDEKKLKADEEYETNRIVIDCRQDTELTGLGLLWQRDILEYIDSSKDSVRHLTECTLMENTIKSKPKQIKFDEIFTQRLSYSKQQMKMLLAKTGFIVNQSDMLKYAELLYLSGQYSKSFDLIKQHYQIDADYAYRLLNYITQNCKNQKLNQSINNFIIDKALDKEGFGQAMLEAIVDGVDDYFDKNPSSLLKDKHWL